VLIMTSDSDVKCELRKNFMSHWLVKGLYHEFIVENINTWDPHTTSIVNLATVEKTYTTIAEGDRGPQIAEHFNTVATQFPIRGKHKETVKILSNFLDNCLMRVSNEGKVGITLIKAFDLQKRKRQTKSSHIPADYFKKVPQVIDIISESSEDVYEMQPSASKKELTHSISYATKKTRPNTSNTISNTVGKPSQLAQVRSSSTLH
jgi:hypothetical protein